MTSLLFCIKNASNSLLSVRKVNRTNLQKGDEKMVRLNEVRVTVVRLNRKVLLEIGKTNSRDQRKQFEIIKVRVNRCSSYRDLTVYIV